MNKLTITDLLQMSGKTKVISFFIGEACFLLVREGIFHWCCTKPYWIMVTLWYLLKVMEQEQNYLGDLKHWTIYYLTIFHTWIYLLTVQEHRLLTNIQFPFHAPFWTLPCPITKCYSASYSIQLHISHEGPQWLKFIIPKSCRSFLQLSLLF